MKVLMGKIIQLHKEMLHDSNERMKEILCILRARRLSNHRFASNTSLNALKNEVQQLQRLPWCVRKIQKLRDET